MLAAAFDDPEVMAAVNDVAANPSHMKKYEKNPKVGSVAELHVRHPACLALAAQGAVMGG